MSKDKEEICANCHWAVASASGSHYYCKVNPPVFTHHDERGHPRFYNPVVGAASFCSLWDERDD